MEAKDLGGSAAVFGLNLLPTYPTEALEDGYGLGEVAGGPEPALPPAPKDVLDELLVGVAVIELDVGVVGGDLL